MAPSLRTLRSLNSTGSMPIFSAASSIWSSAAKEACGLPNPLKAPAGTLLVYATWPSMCTFGIAYGPAATMTATKSTRSLREA